MEIEMSTKSKNLLLVYIFRKALTWDVLCLKGRAGPGWCYLCKMEGESNFHIGVECPFTHSVWLLIVGNLKLNDLWSGVSVSNCFRNWCLNMEAADFIPLPIIVLWFIWRARNLSCFEDLSLPPAQVSSFSLGMMGVFPQKSFVASIRTISVEVIDKTYAWGFFTDLWQGYQTFVELEVCYIFLMIIFYPLRLV